MATFAKLRERLSPDCKQFEHVCKWFLEGDPLAEVIVGHDQTVALDARIELGR